MRITNKGRESNEMQGRSLLLRCNLPVSIYRLRSDEVASQQHGGKQQCNEQKKKKERRRVITAV